MNKTLALFVMTLLFVSCNEDPVSTNNHDQPVKANPFVGKWVELFDTTADAKFTKEQKLAYWYLGDFTGWIIPDTMTFINDSVVDIITFFKDSVLHGNLHYWYDSTNFHITDLVQYDGIKYDTVTSFYKFPSKDSFYISLDSAIFERRYIPPYVKIK